MTKAIVLGGSRGIGKAISNSLLHHTKLKKVGCKKSKLLLITCAFVIVKPM